MFKHSKQLLAALLAVGSIGSAHAVMTIWTFAGVTDAISTHPGAMVSGSLTFDPGVTNAWLTGVVPWGGGAYQEGASTYLPPYSEPQPLLGTVSVNSYVYKVAIGSDNLFTTSTVVKNADDNINQGLNLYNIAGVSAYQGSGTSILLSLFDYKGLASNIFDQVGFDLDQSVNWLAGDAIAQFSLGNSSDNSYDYGSITSMTVTRATQTSVPEPGSIALLGLGLAGFAGARRQKSA